MSHYYPSENPYEPTEWAGGIRGVSDPRYWNKYRRSRRITGPLVSRILERARRDCPARILFGSDGIGPDNLYHVPIEVLDAIDPRTDNPPRTWK